MKSIIRLVALSSAATAALALAGNALATPKLSVRQTSTSLTLGLSRTQSDPVPAKTQIFVPTGYTLNTSQAPGTKIGSASGMLFAKDLNVSAPFTGDVVVAPDDRRERRLRRVPARRLLSAGGRPAGDDGPLAQRRPAARRELQPFQRLHRADRTDRVESPRDPLRGGER